MPKKYTKAMTPFQRHSLGLMWATLGMAVLGVVAQHGSDTLAYFKRVADATKNTYSERTSGTENQTSGPKGNREGRTDTNYVDQEINLMKRQMDAHKAQMDAHRKQMDDHLYGTRTDVPFEAASKHPTQEAEQKSKNEN